MGPSSQQTCGITMRHLGWRQCRLRLGHLPCHSEAGTAGGGGAAVVLPTHTGMQSACTLRSLGIHLCEQLADEGEGGCEIAGLQLQRHQARLDALAQEGALLRGRPLHLLPAHIELHIECISHYNMSSLSQHHQGGLPTCTLGCPDNMWHARQQTKESRSITAAWRQTATACMPMYIVSGSAFLAVIRC